MMITNTTQTRSARAASSWPPPSSGLMHTRPWRSSPLAGPAFSTLPHAIPEASEESHESDGLDKTQGHPCTRSPSSSSIASHGASLSASASGYVSRNASSSASALLLPDGEASTSSISLTAGTGPLSQPNTQTHAHRLSNSWGRRPSSAHGDLARPKHPSDVITPPPRARTVSHGHSRPTSFPVLPVTPSLSIPQAYSRASPSPSDSDATNTAKQSPSTSRDPSSNWMSASPFGPAQTPKFSRLAMASSTVVMPLSAKEYRKQKAKVSIGKGKVHEPPSSSRVAFIDHAVSSSSSQSSNAVPLVKVSPPPSEDTHMSRLPPPSFGDHGVDRRAQPQPQVDHPPAKPFPQPSTSHRPSSPKQKKPRSRPNTPPHSSPLAVRPPISPKSSAGTFFSLASTSDDDSSDGPNVPNSVPPARPRPRPRRRKSFPDRSSSGARLSLLEAMNHLSQEGAAQHFHADGANRLSVASQASGHTLFYDVVESEEGQGKVTGGKGNENADGDGSPRTSILHTQSLEDLSSTLARTGIERDGHLDDPLDDERKTKRNVRTVRISDTVEVSPPPVPRRRKLTKLRPGPPRALVPVSEARPAPGFESVEEVKPQTQIQVQTHEPRASLLPWKSKGSNDGKASVVGNSFDAAAATSQGCVLQPIKGLVQHDETTIPTSVSHSHPSIANGSMHEGSYLKRKSNSVPSRKTPSDAPTSTSMTAPTPDSELIPSSPLHTSRRYTFSFLPSAAFHRSKRQKSNTAPPSTDLGQDQNTKGKLKGSIKGTESSTDSTSTSIRTITQGSQITLVPASPISCDPTTPASSGNLSGSVRGSRSSVPMMRRLNAQEMATTGVLSMDGWDGKGDSTPSLITNGSTTTSSSSPHTPSAFRIGGGGEPFVPRPSALKESFTDPSEDDLDLPGGRTSRMCMHGGHEKSPSPRAGAGWGEMSEEIERYLRPSAAARPASRPGTSSSTVTTATETSASYISFSTIPASTISSPSTSRSESPPSMFGDIDKQEVMPRVLQGDDDEDGDEDVHPCTTCGHRATSPSYSLLPSPTHELDPADMHPMFTVPLVTVPVSTFATPRPGSTTPSEMRSGPRHGGGRKSERHASVAVPAPVGVGVNVNVPRDPNQRDPVTTTSVKMRTMAMTTDKVKTATTTITQAPSTLPSLSPLAPPPLRMRQRRRPQTAPAGTGDAAHKFIEEAKAMRAREGSVDTQVGLGNDRPTKHKAGSRESKFKAIFKGLLRWAA